jgi:hypothetical protein
MTSTPPTSPPASRARRVLERVLVTLACLLIALPLLQTISGHPRDIRLNGAEVTTKEPVFSWISWFNGDFASAVEAWMVGDVGLRGYLVHLASQANYTLFGRIGINGNTKIVEGRDHWLFEQAYLTKIARQREFSRKKAVLIANRAARLREALARKGIAFAIVIAPSKAEILPEYLPAGVPASNRDPKTPYARLAGEFQKQGVPLLDGREFFRSIKEKEIALFPQGGIHWSYYSAWLAWQKLVGVLRLQPACAELPLQSVERLVWHAPLGSDADLRLLLNLWHFEPGGPAPLPYPLVSAPPPALQKRFGALVVGDSFALTLIDAMARSGAFRKIDLLYYFKRRFSYPSPAFMPAGEKLIAEAGKDLGPFDVTRVPWEAFLEDRQMVVLTVNEINIKDGGWGFIESLLAELDPGSKAMATAAPDRGSTKRPPGPPAGSRGRTTTASAKPAGG